MAFTHIFVCFVIETANNSYWLKKSPNFASFNVSTFDHIHSMAYWNCTLLFFPFNYLLCWFRCCAAQNINIGVIYYFSTFTLITHIFSRSCKAYIILPLQYVHLPLNLRCEVQIFWTSMLNSGCFGVHLAFVW